jgi:hypothetical protein
MENVFEHRISIFEPERESDPIVEMKSEKTFISFSKGDLIKGIGNGPMKIVSIEHRMSTSALGVSIFTSIYTTKLD